MTAGPDSVPWRLAGRNGCAQRGAAVWRVTGARARGLGRARSCERDPAATLQTRHSARDTIGHARNRSRRVRGRSEPQLVSSSAKPRYSAGTVLQITAACGGNDIRARLSKTEL